MLKKILFLAVILCIGGTVFGAPGDIAGLEVWLDGSTITGANGTDLTIWTDSSGNSRDATNGLSAYTQYPPEITSDTIGTTSGAKAANFNNGAPSGNEALEISNWHPSKGDYTIFVLAKTTDTRGYLVGQDLGGTNTAESVFGFGDTMGHPDLPDHFGELAFTNDGTSEGGAFKIVASGDPTDADGNWHIYSVIVQDNPTGGVGADVTLNIDGVDVATGQIDTNGVWGSDGIQPVTIAGNFGGSPENALDVDIAQVLIYNGALSDHDFMAVGYFLELTYGLDTAFNTPPGLVLISKTEVSVAEGGATDSYSLSLDTSPTSAVTIDINDDADPDQVTFNQDQLVFDEFNHNTPQMITVTAVDDYALESHPHSTTISHTVSQPGGNQENDGSVVSDVSVTISENDCGHGPFSPVDFNEDCIVDLEDFAFFAFEWLDCSIDNSSGECPKPQLLRFGVVTDVHHTTVPHVLPDIGDRAEDLQNFTSVMNTARAEFVITTGDMIHEGYNGSKASRYNNEIFTANVTTYKNYIGTFNGDVYYVLGNHDVSGTLSVSELSAIWDDPATDHHMPSGYYYFDYPAHKVRFIVLDAQYDTDGHHKYPLCIGYAVGYIPPVEQAWLSAQLADARTRNYRVIIFIHQLIEDDSVYGLLNYSEVEAILSSYNDVVLLAMSGHLHGSGLTTVNGISYISLAAMTNNNDNWALVELYPDNHISVWGHGLVPDWDIP